MMYRLFVTVVWFRRGSRLSGVSVERKFKAMSRKEAIQTISAVVDKEHKKYVFRRGYNLRAVLREKGMSIWEMDINL